MYFLFNEFMLPYVLSVLNVLILVQATLGFRYDVLWIDLPASRSGLGVGP